MVTMQHDREYAEWPLIVPWAIPAMLCSLMILELQAVLLPELVHLSGMDQYYGWQALLCLPAIAFLLLGLYYGRYGLNGLYVLAGAMLLTVFVQFNFRGAGIPLGTFDEWRGDYWTWLRPQVIGLTVGFVSGVILQAFKHKSLGGISMRASAIWLLAATGLFAVTSYQSFTSRYITWSSWAPTRAYALGLVVFVLATLLLAVWIKREEYALEA